MLVSAYRQICLINNSIRNSIFRRKSIGNSNRRKERAKDTVTLVVKEIERKRERERERGREGERERMRVVED